MSICLFTFLFFLTTLWTGSASLGIRGRTFWACSLGATGVLLGMLRFCSASRISAKARVDDCFYVTMRFLRVQGASDRILHMIADRMDCEYIGHYSAIASGM